MFQTYGVILRSHVSIKCINIKIHVKLHLRILSCFYTNCLPEGDRSVFEACRHRELLNVSNKFNKLVLLE